MQSLLEYKDDYLDGTNWLTISIGGHSDRKFLMGLDNHKLSWKALEATTDLDDWTVVRNGFFMDYWGMPKVPSTMPMFHIAVDIPNNMAAIPGDGTCEVEFTHTTDVARFVAASLTLKKWDHVTYVMGDRLSCNDLVKLVEAAKGKCGSSWVTLSLITGYLRDCVSMLTMHVYLLTQGQSLTSSMTTWRSSSSSR
jgi:nucleoside-diphosphate-sugar epimerase